MTMEENGQTIEEKILTDKFLNKWLNAYEYHSDSDKKAFIEQLHKYYPLEATKTLLLGFLLKKVEAIEKLNEFIGLVITENLVG